MGHCAQPDFSGLLGARHIVLRRAVHVSRGLVVRVHPGAGLEPDAVWADDVFHIAGLHRMHHAVPTPARALWLRRAVALAAVLTLSGGTVMGLLAMAGVRNTWAITLPF